MSIKNMSKTSLTATTILSGLFYLTQLSAAGIDNLAGIKKDIKVISKVLESSTELKGSHSKVRISGNYLAKQGIVLKIQFPGTSRFDFNFDGFGSVAPIPVIPDIPDIPDAPGIFSEGELETIISDALDSARDAMVDMPVVPDVDYSNFPFSSSSSEASKQYRIQQKELRKQQRELEKNVRDLAIQERKNSSKKNQQLLEKKRQEISAIREKMKQKSLKMQQELKLAKKKKQAVRTTMVNTWTNNLVDNFCSYAPYPRNLPNGEYLTLVISDAAYRDNRLEDRIIVINKNQLTSCRDGKIDGKNLLSKALSYSF